MFNVELYELSLSKQGLDEKAAMEQVQLVQVLETLSFMGYYVRRYALDTEPRAFLESWEGSKALDLEGDSAFPMLFVDDELRCSGHYPSLEEWANLTEIEDLEQRLLPLPEDAKEAMMAGQSMADWLYSQDATSASACASCGCGGCSGCGCGSWDEEDEDLI